MCQAPSQLQSRAGRSTDICKEFSAVYTLRYAGAPSSQGNAMVPEAMPLFGRPSWLPLPASTVSGHTTAPLVHALGPARSRSCFGSTTSCLPSSASTISRTASNKGWCCASSSRAPSSPNSPARSPNSRPCDEGPTGARPFSPTMRQRSSRHRLRGPGRRPGLSLRGNLPEAPPLRAA